MARYGLTGPRLALGGIMLLGAALRLWRLERNEFGTEYYTAGVRSMTQSWHNFLYNSFDPAGFVSLDKPPVAFWIQTLSARSFGFSELAVLLPQVVEGLLSILVLHFLVARRFGSPSGLLAALFLALTPVAVAVDRSSNTESSLVLCLLLAAWAATVAAERGSLALLALTALLMGIAFNIKMLVALALLPTLGLVYLLFAPLPWLRRALHLAVATAILAPVALSWTIVFDLTPKDQRPYAGSSKRNSMLELIVQHNAADRFTLPERPDPPQSASEPAPPPPRPALYDAVPTGPLRLADPHLARQILWLLPLVVLGLVAIFGARTSRSAYQTQFADVDVRAPAARSDLLLWLGWALTYAIAYSAAGGIFHAYYLVTLAPPLAALAGIGTAALWRRSGAAGWRRWLLPAAVASTALWQLYIAGEALGWPLGRLVPQVARAVSEGVPTAAWQTALFAGLVVAGIAGAAALTLGAQPRARAVTLSLGLAGVLLLPAAWSLGCAIVPGNIMLPAARLADLAKPEEPNVAPGIRRMRTGRVPLDPKLVQFLLDNRADAKFLVAVPNARMAAPLIIQTGQPAMALGGFAGTDPILTPEQLAQRVAAGEVRYLLLGPPGSFGLDPDGNDRRRKWIDWARANGRFVSPPLWSDRDRNYRYLLLFDLRGGPTATRGQ